MDIKLIYIGQLIDQNFSSIAIQKVIRRKKSVLDRLARISQRLIVRNLNFEKERRSKMLKNAIIKKRLGSYTELNR